MFDFLKSKKPEDGSSPEERIKQSLEDATRRKWQIVSFSPESITVELVDQVAAMDQEVYADYIEKLKNLSDNFFIENDESLKCRVKTSKVDRFISIINEDKLATQKLINDAVTPE